MDKFAQDRGILNHLREKANLTGKLLETINPEFSEIMDRLRATDKRIRENAEMTKDFVRAATSHTNRRDYLYAATNMSGFHERCRIIAAELKRFIDSIDLKHYKFILDEFDDEEKEKLFGYNPSEEVKLDDAEVDDTPYVDEKVITAALAKQAGVKDLWYKYVQDPVADLAHNVGTGRGNAMRAFEKRFSVSFLKELKSDTNNMVARTQKFLKDLLSIFKVLGTGVATRNVNLYVEAAKKFISKFAIYHTYFIKYYNKSIVPLKQQHEKQLAEKPESIEKERAAEEEKSRQMEEEAYQQRENPGPSSLQQQLQQQFVAPNSPGYQEPQKAYEGVSVKEKQDALNRLEKERAEQDHSQPIPFVSPKDKENALNQLDQNRDSVAIPLTNKKNVAANFIAKITKIAEKTNDPKAIALEILNYSETLEDTNPEASLKLLAVAEGILEKYAAPGIFDFLKSKKPETKDIPQPAPSPKVDPVPKR